MDSPLLLLRSHKIRREATTTKTLKTGTTSKDTRTSSSTTETSCSSTKSLVLVDYSDAEDDDDVDEEEEDVDKNNIGDQELLDQFNSLFLNTNDEDLWTIVKTQR
jgi:hypothetical protein